MEVGIGLESRRVQIWDILRSQIIMWKRRRNNRRARGLVTVVWGEIVGIIRDRIRGDPKMDITQGQTQGNLGKVGIIPGRTPGGVIIPGLKVLLRLKLHQHRHSDLLPRVR